MAGAAFLAGAAFFAGADLVVDFEPELVLLDVDDLVPELDDLLAVDLEAEPDDLPAELPVPVDLLAAVFDADEPEEDFAAPDLAAGFAEDLLAPELDVVFDAPLVEVDFDAVFAPEDLPPVEAALVGAAFLVDDEAALVVSDFLFVVVDFVELVAGFLVGIFFSLKCFRTNFTKTGLKQTHERIFTRIVSMCQDIF